MKFRRRVITCIGALCVGLLAPSSVRSGPAEVDEVLAVVPDDMAACVILNDLSGHFERFRRSRFFARIERLPVITRLRESNEFGHLLVAQGMIRLHFGVDFRVLFDRLLGRAVVLAFRPGDPDTGILFLRASDPQFLGEMIEALSKIGGKGQAQIKRHRGIEYFRRLDEHGPERFLLAIDSIGVLTDKESAIRQVIDASLDGDDRPEAGRFRTIREALPTDTLLQVLLFTEPFDALIENQATSSNPVETLFANMVASLWQSLKWTALTLRASDHIELTWHASFDPDHHSQSDSPSSASEFSTDLWKRTPADALAVYSGSWDFPTLLHFARQIAASDSEGDLPKVGALFDQMLAGFDAADDLTPNLGPDVGLIVTDHPDRLLPDALAVAQLRLLQQAAGGLPTLSLALEFALRPALVMIGFDWNKKPGAAWHAAMARIGPDRIHYLTNENDANSPKPCYAIFTDQCLFATSPEVIRAWLDPRSEKSLAETPFARHLFAAAPAGTAFVAYANLSAIAEWAEEHRERIVAMIAKGRTERFQRVGKRFDDLRSMLALLDRIVVARTANAETVRVTVSVFPSAGGD